MPFEFRSSLIDEYGRVVMPTAVLRAMYNNDENHWVRLLSNSGGTSIEGNPSNPDNDGLEGLAWHHCLGSMMNHALGDNANVAYLTVTGLDRASPQLVYPFGNRSFDSVLMVTTRDCYPHEQALTKYGGNAAQFFSILFR